LTGRVRVALIDRGENARYLSHRRYPVTSAPVPNGHGESTGWSQQHLQRHVPAQ
jgi:hypothetical protein